MARIAKVFRSGNSQAVRLPKAFRFDVEEVEVWRDGDAVILRPRADEGRPWASLRAAIERAAGAGFMAEGRDEPADRMRPESDGAVE